MYVWTCPSHALFSGTNFKTFGKIGDAYLIGDGNHPFFRSRAGLQMGVQHKEMPVKVSVESRDVN